MRGAAKAGRGGPARRGAPGPAAGCVPGGSSTRAPGRGADAIQAEGESGTAQAGGAAGGGLGRNGGGGAQVEGGFRSFLENDTWARVALLVAVTFAATGVLGLALERAADFLSSGHARFVGVFFIITGVLLVLADRVAKGSKAVAGGRVRDALVVGIFQGLAVLPGLSRSGLTIFAGLWRGFDGRDAARFSFLAAIPAMIAATAWQAAGKSPQGQLLPNIVGAAAAFVSGYASLALLVRVLESRKLRYFAPYLLALGAFVLFLLR